MSHDHGMMHGGHESHGGMHGDEPMCNMNMLFNWDPTDLCIIFPSWHIRNTFQLIASLIAIVALTAGYELVREISRRYENQVNAWWTASPAAIASGRNADAGKNIMVAGRRRSRTIKGLLYAVQVFYSFFIMLLFMTYNGWVMIAVAVGAFVGYMAFGGSNTATKTVACH